LASSPRLLQEVVSLLPLLQGVASLLLLQGAVSPRLLQGVVSLPLPQRLELGGDLPLRHLINSTNNLAALPPHLRAEECSK